MDIINWSNEKGIITNTRGSAAGSLVSYVLGITTVDPIRYYLPFERFLNPYRPSPPDIDADVADDRREEVIDYIREKYGKENVNGHIFKKDCVKNKDHKILVTHNYKKNIGVAKIIEHPDRLDVDIELNDDIELMIGFFAPGFVFKKSSFDGDTRIIEEIDLKEISLIPQN